MQYVFQRIINNGYQWMRPSPGRLGPSGEGDYVQKSGFGHEDWNFNENLAFDGYIYGYTYYQPSEDKKDDEYDIAFATYSNGVWRMVGCYRNARWVKSAPYSRDVVERKVNDLLLLGGSLGRSYRKMTKAELHQDMKYNLRYLNWKVLVRNVFRAEVPADIPKALFSPKNYRIVKPTMLDKARFARLSNLLGHQLPASDAGEVESEFPEGRLVEIRHRERERNPALVRSAKNAFLARHGRLFCQVCGFDFQKTYGAIGTDFIEAHHTLPVSSMTRATKTRVTDIALVCPNCHRMLHRKRPWLSLKNLIRLIEH